MNCPCCGGEIQAPSIDVAVDYTEYQPGSLGRSILEAVWKGKGFPVSNERIFAAMYADDPSGGPDEAAMYRAFKVSLSRLKKRLQGSGVTIENAGYGRGYRLVFTKGEAQ